MLLHHLADQSSPRIMSELRSPLTHRLLLVRERMTSANTDYYPAARSHMAWQFTHTPRGDYSVPDICDSTDPMDYLEPLLERWSRPIFTLEVENWTAEKTENLAWLEEQWQALLPGSPPLSTKRRSGWIRGAARFLPLLSIRDDLMLFRLQPRRYYYGSPITNTDRHIRALVRKP
jgi:hypothetical protein